MPLNLISIDSDTFRVADLIREMAEASEVPQLIAIDSKSIELVKSGKVTVLVRQGGRNYRLGETLLFSSGEVSRVDVFKVETKEARALTHIESWFAHRTDPEGVLRILQESHPSVNAGSAVTVVEFYFVDTVEPVNHE